MTIQLAQRGLELRKQIIALTAQLDIVNTQLINETGSTGNTYNLADGKVIITQLTNSRPSGKYNQKFNASVFDALADTSKLKKDIISKGIVTFEQGVTSGRSPVVQYKLA